MSMKPTPVLAVLILAVAACAPAAPPASTAPPADCPAVLPDLVDVSTLDPAPAVDLRYATADNFTGAPLPGYETPRALLRPEAAAALERIGGWLRNHGMGLKVWDAYRPVRATLAMVDWAERTGNQWVLDEGYVARRSGHNRGATVDLTIISLDTGRQMDMGTAYDTFSEDSHTENAWGEVLWNRGLLVRAMEEEGFENYEREWWHFSMAGDYEPMDVPLGCYGGS